MYITPVFIRVSSDSRHVFGENPRLKECMSVVIEIYRD